MSNVIQFPTQDIPSIMRRVADQIEAGEIDPKTVIAIMVDGDDQLDLYGWGVEPSTFEVAGIIAEAQLLWSDMGRVDE